MASEEFSAQPGEEVAREEAPAADFSSEGDDEGRAAVFDEEGAEAEDEFEAAEEGRLDTASPPPEEAAGGEGGGEEGLGEEEGYEEEEFDEQAAAETEQVHARGALLEEVPELSAEVAEVVLVTTSLGSIKRQFFASKRLQHFLDCKGVVYCSVDCNRDLSTAMSKTIKRSGYSKKKKDRLFLGRTREALRKSAHALQTSRTSSCLKSGGVWGSSRQSKIRTRTRQNKKVSARPPSPLHGKCNSQPSAFRI